MKSYLKIMITVLAALFISESLHAQGDLNIFGFYQVRFRKTVGDYSVAGNVPTPVGVQKVVFDEAKDNFKDPSIQQLNLFLRNEITGSLTSFINLEFVNNFSTENDWGSLNLQEAWLNYGINDALNIKAGILIPRFNYLNELKNKMPLLPYITRPLVYETSLAAIIGPHNFLPERAFLQVSGVLPVNDIVFDYAAYVGPAEKRYIHSGSKSSGSITSGTDSTNFFLVGGRFGMNYSNLRLGVSATVDKANEQGTLKEDVSRTRIGLDAGYTVSNLFFEGEYIKVMLDPKNTDQDIDKSFYYGLLGYNFSDEIFGFGTYSNVTDKQVEYLSTGMSTISGGFGYRPIPTVVIKLEYTKTYVADDAKISIPIDPNIPPISADMDLDFKSVNLAISVVF